MWCYAVYDYLICLTNERQHNVSNIILLMQAVNLITDALNHDGSDVRAAACICLRSVSRSIKVPYRFLFDHVQNIITDVCFC